jgi:hypothetical protein
MNFLLMQLLLNPCFQKKVNPKVVEIAPGVKLKFVKIPAGKFIMGANNRPSDYSPAHIAEVKTLSGWLKWRSPMSSSELFFLIMTAVSMTSNGKTT